MLNIFSKVIKNIFRILPFYLKLKIEVVFPLIRQKFLGPFVDGLYVNTWNGKFLVPSVDFLIGKQLAYKGQWDKDHVERLIGLVSNKSNVLFVGTHIGCLFIPISKKVNKVVGIEANPDTFQFLTANLLLNNVQNAEVYNYAAGDKHGEISFVKNQSNTGGSKILPKKDFSREFKYDNPEIIQVPMKLLDEEFPDISFDLIVMDIEGSEYFALKGMEKLLENTQILQCEILFNHLKKVAGVAVAEFMAIFEKYFVEALILLPNNTVHKIKSEEFLQVEDIFKNLLPKEINKSETNGGDVIFFKSLIPEKLMNA